MSDRTIAQLVQKAGLDASLADEFVREEVTVELLLNATLTERREVLRAMGVSYGVLLSLNRVLETWRTAAEAAGGVDGDEDDRDESKAEASKAGAVDIGDAKDADAKVAPMPQPARQSAAAAEPAAASPKASPKVTATAAASPKASPKVTATGAATPPAMAKSEDNQREKDGASAAPTPTKVASAAPSPPKVASAAPTPKKTASAAATPVALRSRISVSAALETQLRAAALLLQTAEPQTLRALATYLGNVLAHPEKSSYRAIQLANPTFHERVWSVSGGPSILRAAGFEEADLAAPGQGGGGVLHLPKGAALKSVEAAKEVVDRIMAAKEIADRIMRDSSGGGGIGGSGGEGGGSDATPADTPSNAYLRSVGSGATTTPSKPPPPTPEERAAFHRQAASAVPGLLDDAHTRTWDAALASSSAVRVDHLSTHEIRACRRCNQGRLAALLGRLTRMLWETVVRAATEPNEGLGSADRRKLNNALLLVSRLMPVLLEDIDDAGINHLLWTPLPKPPNELAAKAALESSALVARQMHTVGGCLLHAVVRAFFAPGYTTVPGEDAAVEASSSSSSTNSSGGGGGGGEGASSNLWATSSGSLDEARVVVMTALLACTSATLFTPPSEAATRSNRMLLAAVGAPDPYGKALFRALLTVIFSYDPIGYGIPLAGALLGDSHGPVMERATQLLLVLLSQPAGASPGAVPPSASPPPSQYASPAAAAAAAGLPPPGVSPLDRKPLDRVSRFLAGLQRESTLGFLSGGFNRLLMSRRVAEGSYFGGASGGGPPLECEMEVVVLLWLTLSLNRAFVAHLLASQAELIELTLSLCHLAFSWASDLSSASAVHLCVHSLLLLSAEPDFASIVNLPSPKPLTPKGADVNPHAAAIAAEASCHALGDVLVGVVATLWLSPLGPASSTPMPERAHGAYPSESAVALLANIAPHVKTWSACSVGLLQQMVSATLRPRAFFATEYKAELLVLLVEVLHLSLLYTHHSNHTLLQMLVGNEALVRRMLTMPLPNEDGSKTADDPDEDEEEEDDDDDDEEGAGRAPAAAGAPRPAWQTEAWMSSWRARLPLEAILRAIDTLKPKVIAADEARYLPLENAPPDSLKSISLTAVLPPPPAIEIRRYQPSEGSRRWMTQVIWGLIYVGHQQLFDARRVRLVQILQVEE